MGKPRLTTLALAAFLHNVHECSMCVKMQQTCQKSV